MANTSKKRLIITLVPLLACLVGVAYSKLMPETRDTASFFSFYEVAEKLGIVLGMLTYGYIDEMIGMKYSVLALIVFFVAGLACLWYALEAQYKQLKAIQPI